MTASGIPEGWDEGVQSLHGHVLQSSAWARVQERLGNRVVVGADRNWCWLGVVRRAGPFRYLYLPFGPTLRTPAALPAAMAVARARAFASGCAFVRFEPGEVDAAAVIATGARRVHSRQYEDTLVLRLDIDEATLRRGLRSGHRSGINAAARRGISVEATHDPARMADFTLLLRDTEQQRGFFSFEDSYFDAVGAELLPGREATLYFAHADGAVIAGALVFDFGLTRYYAFGATASGARRLAPGPPLVWQSIIDARAAGKTGFDLWGVSPPDAPRDHPWAGITAFKSGFGGEPRRYAGTWEITVRPVAARLFAVADAARRRARRRPA